MVSEPSDRAVISPPCPLTISRAMYRPSPRLPSALARLRARVRGSKHLPQNRRIYSRPAVDDVHSNIVLLPGNYNRTSARGGSILHCVSDQVRQQLLQTATIPHTLAVASHFKLERVVRMGTT